MTTLPSITIGLDLGDRRSHYCVLDAAGHVTSRGTVPTDRDALRAVFSTVGPARVAVGRKFRGRPMRPLLLRYPPGAQTQQFPTWPRPTAGGAG